MGYIGGGLERRFERVREEIQSGGWRCSWGVGELGAVRWHQPRFIVFGLEEVGTLHSWFVVQEQSISKTELDEACE